MLSTIYPSVRYKILLLNRPGGSNGFYRTRSFSRGVAVPAPIRGAGLFCHYEGFTGNPVLDVRSLNCLHIYVEDKVGMLVLKKPAMAAPSKKYASGMAGRQKICIRLTFTNNTNTIACK